MRSPAIYKNSCQFQKINIIYNTLEKTKKKKSEGFKNYSFLVKWSHCSYNELCWEDESVLLDSFQFPLAKFLAIKIFETTFFTEKPVPLINIIKSCCEKYAADFSKALKNPEEN